MPLVPAVRIPVAEPIVAIAVLLLLHVPPEVASLRLEVNPEQTTESPVITGGAGFTVTVCVAVQPGPVA